MRYHVQSNELILSSGEKARSLGHSYVGSIHILLALLDQRDGTEITSLNAPLSEEDAREMEMRLGVSEEGFERVEQQDWLRWVLNQVTPK